MSQIPWHTLSVDQTIEKVRSNKKFGLSLGEVKSRLQQNGPNELPRPKQRSLFSIFIHQFLSPLIYLLILAAAIAFAIGDQKDAIVILVVVTLNAFIGAFQEGRAEQSLQVLRNLSKLKARVLRDGHEHEIESRDVVLGDIIVVSAGDAVPADARLIEVSSLFVAEAALTGESVPVSKSLTLSNEKTVLADRRNMIYAGTYISSGRALGLVVATGIQNEIGKIAQLATSTVQSKTQLELRIAQFGRYIVSVSGILFLLVIGIGFLRGIPFAEIFMIAVSQMVSLIPEGLPVALTIALAVGVQRMAKRGTIVRKLSAVETLGATTVICSDKTGTLTKNEMTVTSIYLPQDRRQISVSGVGYAPIGDFFENGQRLSEEARQPLQKLIEACAYCNDARLLSPDRANRNWHIIGDPTEGALLTLAYKFGTDYREMKEHHHRKAELPFDADIKMMATQYEIDGHQMIFIKGAPEVLIEMCGSYFSEKGPRSDAEFKKQALSAAQAMADSALRVLAVGYLQDEHIDGQDRFSPFQGKMTLLGLVGELDPPRDEVAESIQICQKAGIKPVMVTGDHKATGLAIAKSLGISQPDDYAIDGMELEQFSDEELMHKLNNISVFARVHPAQKLRIIQAFQRKGHVVAMTGDGVNDAPALVRADVGVAMGITGTEVAKEASKIVITDDNFSTIVAAVSEGRLVYQNIKKLILFLFVTSIDEVIILFLALILGYPPPFAAVQILWLNLVSEGALTINLIMEPHEGDEMNRPPISTSEPLLDRSLLMRMPLMVIASVISTFGWFVYRTSQGIDSAQVQTETFTVLVVSQWFNVLNCRSSTKSALTLDLFKNQWLVGGLIIANALHLLVIYWKPLAQFFHTVPIEIENFVALGIVASLVLWVEEVRKLMFRRLTSILS